MIPLQQPQREYIITRTWAMPNKNTFQIPQIKTLIDKYGKDWLDPFPDPFVVDALTTLDKIQTGTRERVLFDPPYSPRQLKECYNNNGECLHDTKASVWRNWKDEIARVVKPDGICISFGWSTGGLGIKRGFNIIEILLVAHGGNHNDTICTVEIKGTRPHTPAPMIDSLDDERLPFSISDEDLIDFNVWMKEHDRTATLAENNRVLDAIKEYTRHHGYWWRVSEDVQRYHWEPEPFKDFLESLRQSTTAAQEDK